MNSLYRKTLILFAIIVLTSCFNKNETALIAHKVTFEHKGSKTERAQKNTLYEVRNEIDSQNNIQFYMDVVSVYCGEDICKIDRVSLHWNTLGFYTHFTLKKGVELEKAFGEDFTGDDYKKLDNILKNSTSELALLHKDELVREVPSGNAVDALSGATVTILRDDYVDGAIWTCYTLWHFANGDITKIIRNLTGDLMIIEELNVLLKSNNFNNQYFAIEQLQRKSAIDERSLNNIVKLVMNISLDKTQQILFNQAVINFVNSLPDKQYFKTVHQLIISNEHDISVLALQSLEPSSRTAPNSYYERLSETLLNTNSFQKIDLFLSLVEKKQVDSKIVIGNLAKLLSSQRFSIARRVYWFLNQHNKHLYGEKIEEALSTFYQKNSQNL